MRRLLLVLVALVLVSSACSAFGAAPAATVDGKEISVDSLDDEVDSIRGNQTYVEQLESSFGVASKGSAGEGTFDAAFVAQILSLRVWYQLIENDLQSRGLQSLLDDVIGEMAESVPADFDGAFGDGAFEKFPKEYQEEIIRQQALPEAASRDLADQIGDDPREFYDTNKDEFAEICVSHALVGTQGGRSAADAEDAAQDLYERIQAGEDFADIATNESDDTGAAAGGGELGCGSRLSLQFDPVFEKAAFDLEVGEVSKPVQTQFGSHLILVTSRETPSYSEVGEAQAQQVMSQAAQERADSYFLDLICGGDVDINPRYGTWSTDSCRAPAPELPRIQPPEGPARASTSSTSTPEG